MLKLMPKLPVVLLLGVAALWWWNREEALALDSTAMRLRSPPISLAADSKGSWTLDWASWSGERGVPLLVAPGWQSDPHTRSPQLCIRVEPRDSVHPGHDQPVDGGGWFRTGNAKYGATSLILDPARTSVIEYRVGDPDPESEEIVRLSIRGWNDGDILEAASVREFLGGAVAVVLGLGLVAWMSAQWVSRIRTSGADPDVRPI